MVLVNFRLKSNYDKNSVINFFKTIGCNYVGINKSSIKLENEYIEAHEYTRDKKGGRYHIFIEFGRKSSGTKKHPQIKIYGHYDIIKIVKGNEKHFFDSCENRILNELDRLERNARNCEDIKFMEYKDKNCAHYTIELKDKEKFMEILSKYCYQNYDQGKYRRTLNHHQYTIKILEQYKYLHIVVVYALIKKDSNQQILKIKKAEHELDKIREELKKN